MALNNNLRSYRLLLMRFFILSCIAFVLLFENIYAQNASIDSIFTYSIDQKIEKSVILGDKLPLFIDQSKSLTIEQVLENPPDFKKYDGSNKLYDEPIVWYRIKLVNQTDSIITAISSFCSYPRNIDIYEIKNNSVFAHRILSENKSPFKKDIITLKNHIRFSLYPNEHKVYYIRADYNGFVGVTPAHIYEFFIRNEHTALKEIPQSMSIQGLYTGIMLMFVLFSLFFYKVFKDPTFLYFALIQFSFIFYFANYYNIVELIAYPYLLDTRMLLSRIGIVFIQISIALFMIKYTNAKKHIKKFYHFYVALVPIVIISQFALFFAKPSTSANEILISNYITIFWAFATFVLLLRLSLKKVRAATNLLLAFSVLFITSIVFILTVSNVIPETLFGIYGIQIGTIMFSLYLLYGLFEIINEIRNAKTKAEALDSLRTEFFTNISHEFRTPLTLIIGPIAQLVDEVKNPKEQKLLKLAYKNANRLQHLINQILDLTKLEHGKVQLEPKKVNLVTFLKGVFMSFESLAEQKNIKLQFTSKNLNVPVYIDLEKMEMVFYNLLSNAFKFTPSGGEISVMIYDENEKLEILVRDTGIGIAHDKIENIFDRFFQSTNLAKNKHEGSGIGLAVAKQYILLHGGSIGVESQAQQGTTFKVLLSKGKNHLNIDTIEEINELELEPKLDPNILENTESESTEPSNVNFAKMKPTILIIEDNHDVRAFIKQQLINQFIIEEAENGELGIVKAKELMPQLIICDVMMPGKSGFEVLEELKGFAGTSHIPMIMLTARADQNEKITGLELGADDYLTKPFDQKELLVRVRKLIDGRTKLREIITQSPTLHFKQLDGKPADVEFLEKVQEMVDKHFNNSDFKVEDLADELKMSRVHLNRKLKSITDNSANKYIQQYRLKKALKLLETEDLSVSEVAFKTGFASTAYFVKCFREFYNKTPGSIKQPE